MSKTKIEWTRDAEGNPGHTWNPVRGCSRISPGCQHCYAERIAARNLPGMKSPTTGQPFAIINGNGPHWTGDVELIPSMLDVPLKRRKPTTYFVNSMSDLFHEKLPDESIDEVVSIMNGCQRHVFQVLTKRADRLPRYFRRFRPDKRGWVTPGGLDAELTHCPVAEDKWPLPNLWLGVSVESRDYLSRIDDLRRTPAAVRFLSLEPLLEDLGDIGHYLRATDEASLECSVCQWRGHEQSAKRVDEPPDDWHFTCPECGETCAHIPLDELRPGIDWVIAGAESGPGARPMNEDWVRSIRDQCISAGVAFFYKQNAAHGRKIPTPELDGKKWVQMPATKASDSARAPALKAVGVEVER